MVTFWDFVVFTFWTLALRTSAETVISDLGQVHLVGSSLPIVASMGEDVILPCFLEPSMNVEALTIEWSKPDLKPDPLDPLGGVEYVHLYRGQREVTDMKIKSYVSRTELFMSELKHGNISLKLTNVTTSDEGRYKCFIPKMKSNVFSIVHLIVDPKNKMTETPPHPTDLQTPDPKNDQTIKGYRSRLVLLVPPLILLILLVGFLFKKKKQI